jgi:hypothetical protein
VVAVAHNKLELLLELLVLVEVVLVEQMLVLELLER